MVRLCVASAFLTLLGAIAAPAASAQSRDCREADLEGVWELVSIRAAEPGVEAFYRQAPVEYMRFGPGGDYIYVARTAKLGSLAEINASLDRTDAVDGMTYVGQFVDSGVLVIFRDGQPFQGFTCGMRADGAMVWTEFPGNPDLERVHRRVR